MQVNLRNKVSKYLDKQSNGDLKGIIQVRLFLDRLEKEANPTFLPNCKKLQGIANQWRWRMGNYRIIGEVKSQELIIHIIEISTRENAYKGD